ncbi:hypothetical protein DSCO28_62340 [Desulfosarcina ovata subsp. sediminis]|uniref:Uncharacterized protein n=1 Tax=Desulfosarcina ovata subsp. sediminis TaxID=885957 RepID=A0A5K7ZZP0_9BACT|nr:hypothetical protein DSCO28_62340 [Desulfosarcina ovata subsp. sediminis]
MPLPNRSIVRGLWNGQPAREPFLQRLRICPAAWNRCHAADTCCTNTYKTASRNRQTVNAAHPAAER